MWRWLPCWCFQVLFHRLHLFFFLSHFLWHFAKDRVVFFSSFHRFSYIKNQTLRSSSIILCEIMCTFSLCFLRLLRVAVPNIMMQFVIVILINLSCVLFHSLEIDVSNTNHLPSRPLFLFALLCSRSLLFGSHTNVSCFCSANIFYGFEKPFFGFHHFTSPFDEFTALSCGC